MNRRNWLIALASTLGRRRLSSSRRSDPWIRLGITPQQPRRGDHREQDHGEHRQWAALAMVRLFVTDLTPSVFRAIRVALAEALAERTVPWSVTIPLTVSTSISPPLVTLPSCRAYLTLPVILVSVIAVTVP